MRKVIREHFFILIVFVMFLSLSACAQTENSIDETKSIQATVIEIEK